jgi:thiamine-phosphate pyrophosphorylase
MICLVTDRRRLSAGADAVDRLVELVEAAVTAGIDLIQVRERDLDARALASLVQRCLAVTGATRSQILVNDRADVAAAVGAAGVHLRGDSIGVSAARTLLGESAIVGQSVHSSREASLASEAGADYLIFGTLFQTPSKDEGHPLASLDQLREACHAAAGVPVLAIGGITLERVPDLARCGAAGIAGVGVFLPPAGVSAERHLHTVTAELRRSFDTCEVVT